MAYPTTSDLSTFLASNGITVDSTLLGQAVNGAVARWEELTNYAPFFSSSATAVYDFYDPPQSDVLPVNGYVSLSAVYYNVIATRAGGQSSSTVNASNNGNAQSIVITTPSGAVTFAGIEATPFVDYWPIGGDATAGKKPITALRMGVSLQMFPRSVLVYGRRGYCSTLAANHFNAILKGAACLAIESSSQKASTGLSEINLGDLDVKWQGTKDSQSLAWMAEFEAQAKAVRRVTF